MNYLKCVVHSFEWKKNSKVFFFVSLTRSRELLVGLNLNWNDVVAEIVVTCIMH